MHKYTCTQPTKNLKSIIDCGIIRESGRIDVRDVRVHRGTTQISDHYLLKVKARFPFSKNKTIQNHRTNTMAEEEKFNLESLQHQRDNSIRGDLIINWKICRIRGP